MLAQLHDLEYLFGNGLLLGGVFDVHHGLVDDGDYLEEGPSLLGGDLVGAEDEASKRSKLDDVGVGGLEVGQLFEDFGSDAVHLRVYLVSGCPPHIFSMDLLELVLDLLGS